MPSMMWLASAFFLPLFPLSMGFNALFARFRHPLLRTVMLLAWPQIGVVVLSEVTTPIPAWVLALALMTSLLYGVRALALRELGLWTSFLATSSWALLWIPAYDGADALTLHLYALGFSVPLVLLALLPPAWNVASARRIPGSMAVSPICFPAFPACWCSSCWR